MSDLSEAMQKLAQEAEAIFNEPTYPNFCDEDTVQSVSDLELAGPIARLLNARNWYLADKDKLEEATVEILKAISDLEFGLLNRWRAL